MKLVVLVIPLLGVSAFAGYYHYWNSVQRQEMTVCRLPRGEEPYAKYRHRDGKRDAEDDFARGHPRILSYGLPAPWINEYGEILLRDYGVELEAVAGCVVSTPLIDYVAAYNQTIEGHLTAVHGAGLFDKLYKDAEALHLARHKQL